MRNSFWGLISSSFQEIQGLWIGIISLALSVVLAVVAAKTSIPLYIVVIIVVIALLVAATLWKAASDSFKEYKKIFTDYQKLKNRIVPRILVARKQTSNTELKITCLLEYSDLFANDSYISFYYVDDDGYEVFIALGFIVTIQADGKMQALIDMPDPNYQEILEKLASNNESIKQKITVKPNFTRDIGNRFFNNSNP